MRRVKSGRSPLLRLDPNVHDLYLTKGNRDFFSRVRGPRTEGRICRIRLLMRLLALLFDVRVRCIRSEGGHTLPANLGSFIALNP